MFDESRDSYFKDPHAVARQREREMVDRIADMITSVVIDGAIESATAPLVDGYMELTKPPAFYRRRTETTSAGALCLESGCGI